MKECSYHCPVCHHLLERQKEQLLCPSCKKRWPLSGKIPSFSDREFYWNHISKEKMEELIYVAKDKGYKYALKDILLKETNPYIYYLASEENRADFSVLLDIDSKAKVLDIGCSWGAISTGLARRCGQMHAVDSIMESLRFVQIQAEQEALSNIHLAKIEPLDYASLPFSDDCFDVVVLNGVLEWIGSARTDLPVEDIREKALREIKRVLKPDGRLYIAIENRYSLLYFLGATDHHGLPFTSIVPRFLADRLMRLVKKRGYRTYTHSFSGYKRFLKQCGFNRFSFYMPLPTYHKPFYLIPLDAPNALKYFLATFLKKSDSPSVKRKIIVELASRLRFLWLYKAFAPSFAIIAQGEK